MYTRCLSKIFSGSFILCFLLTAIAVLGTAQPARAAVPTTFYVKAGASGSCSSWSDACDLQAALGAAVSRYGLPPEYISLLCLRLVRLILEPSLLPYLTG